MKKEKLLDKIKATKKDIEENGVTDILIVTKSPDKVGYYCASDPITVLGLANVVQMKTREDYQKIMKGNQMHQLLHDFLDNSDDE